MYVIMKLLKGGVMSKKEKELYYDSDITLEYINKFKRKMVELDNVFDPKERRRIFSQLLKKLGDDSYIMFGFRCEYGNIEIGNDVLINMDCCLLDAGGISIGDHVWIAPHTCIFSIGHPVAPEGRVEDACLVAPVVIGNNVWIGGNSTINPGVTIGENTVIGSGSVVTSDIPANVIAVGNPCRVLRKITEEDSKEYRKMKEEYAKKLEQKMDMSNRVHMFFLNKNKDLL